MSEEFKLYHRRHNMIWSDVKKAMSRVKKFRSLGFYLEVDEQHGYIREQHTVESLWPPNKKDVKYYTGKLFGPKRARKFQ